MIRGNVISACTKAKFKAYLNYGFNYVKPKSQISKAKYYINMDLSKIFFTVFATFAKVFFLLLRFQEADHSVSVSDVIAVLCS